MTTNPGLQLGLNALQDWSNTWLLKLNMFPIRFSSQPIAYTTLYAWPTRGVPFDGLMGKGNQLLVTQTIIRIDLSLTLIMTFVLQRSVHDGRA